MALRACGNIPNLDFQDVSVKQGGTLMRQIIDFPSIPFAQLPTPLYKLENLSREIG